jgi:hypothetical protein
MNYQQKQSLTPSLPAAADSKHTPCLGRVTVIQGHHILISRLFNFIPHTNSEYVLLWPVWLLTEMPMLAMIITAM